MNQKCILNWIVIVGVHGLLGFQFLFFGVFWAWIYFFFGGVLGTGWICEHLCTRRVSLRYRFGYRFGTGENVEQKGTSFARKHQWTNCISRYCKVSLLVVHHIAFHGLEPLSRKRAPHKRLLHKEFSRFLRWSQLLFPREHRVHLHPKIIGSSYGPQAWCIEELGPSKRTKRRRMLPLSNWAPIRAPVEQLVFLPICFCSFQVGQPYCGIVPYPSTCVTTQVIQRYEVETCRNIMESNLILTKMPGVLLQNISTWVFLLTAGNRM